MSSSEKKYKGLRVGGPITDNNDSICAIRFVFAARPRKPSLDIGRKQCRMPNRLLAPDHGLIILLTEPAPPQEGSNANPTESAEGVVCFPQIQCPSDMISYNSCHTLSPSLKSPHVHPVFDHHMISYNSPRVNPVKWLGAGRLAWSSTKNLLKSPNSCDFVKKSALLNNLFSRCEHSSLTGRAIVVETAFRKT